MREKKFGKRCLTWVLVLMMTLSLLPVSALAEDGEARFYGKNVTIMDDCDNTSVSAAAVQNTDTEGEEPDSTAAPDEGDGEKGDTPETPETEPEEESEKEQYVAQIVETQKTYETVAAAIEAAQDGQTVKLLRDVEESITISKSLTLDLAGFTLSGADEESAVVTITGSDETKPEITIKSSKLEEEKPVNGTITGGKKGGIRITDAGVTLNEVAVTENTTQDNGGGIYIKNGTLNISGGEVTHNSAAGKTETFETSTGGGAIKGYYGGGGIFARNSVVSLNGVSVSHNEQSSSSSYHGGGILLYYGKLNIENCTIDQNITDGCGGGVCIVHADVNVSDSYIDSNKSQNGAGIYFYDGSDHKEAGCPGAHKHRITGTQISNNQASSTGGGMYTGTTGKIFISDCSITKNRASSGGGISSFSTADVTFDKVSITENEAPVAGGFYINATLACNTDVKLQNGTEIEKNSATIVGGGIYANAMLTTQLSIAVANSSISNNTAANGAGIATNNQHNKATINVNLEPGTVVQNNAATTCGGGIYVPNKANIHVAETVTTDDGVSEGIALYNNTAGTAGDDLFLNGATFTLPAAAAMSGDLKLASDNEKITGWYHDGWYKWDSNAGEDGAYVEIPRWNAAMEDGSKYYDKYTPAVNDNQAIALKAAHGLMCTVTYTDGVENAEIFADKVCAVEQGSPTPAFGDEDPVREGYKFKGWAPEVAETVTADVIYVAQWKRNGGHHPSKPDNTVEIPDDDALGLNTDDHFAYIIGYPDGTVQPNGQITRAEATTIFFRLLTDESREANLTKTNGYTDVAFDAWYNTAVSTMTKAGIVDGYPDGTFRPDAPITRAEMAKIISLFAKLDKSESRFYDIAGHWAEAYIRLAAGNGWIAGYPDGTFGPQRNITRAETATMINRVLERVPSEESRLLDRAAMQTWPDANPGDWFYLAMQEATNSHDYERNAKWAAADEQWTALRETRDWKALEQ